MTFKKGDRVKTNLGNGEVQYVRMGPPTYTKVAAVSVILDEKKNNPRYSGTIINIENVKDENDSSILTYIISPIDHNGKKLPPKQFYAPSFDMAIEFARIEWPKHKGLYCHQSVNG